MSIKIDFDVVHNPIPPTIVLAKRNGDKIGVINAHEISATDSMADYAEISFNVYKYVDGKKDILWDDIKDFRLVHCVEWDTWFEIKVEIDESTETTKTVFCTQLGKAEMSQSYIYNMEINTENDIKREDYDEKNPTVLYREDLPSSSLLHRILEKFPHYHVNHVDDTIAGIQRTFEFDETSVDEAFQEIAKEINCLFVYDNGSDDNGRPCRTISVYDLESNCLNVECGYRGEFNDVCPKCGCTDISYYGEDTGIFVTSDKLAESIELSVDVDEVKNCFKLEAGDDLMTASIRNYNPNGSDYIWHISESTKEDMSEELVAKINSYDELYEFYKNEYIPFEDDPSIFEQYNKLVSDYKNYNEDLQNIELPVKGYQNIMNAYYDTIDFELFLRSGLMPTIEIDETTAANEAAKLVEEAISPVSADDTGTSSSFKNMSKTSADLAVLSMAKVIADSTRFKITVHDGSTFDKDDEKKKRGYHIWTGCFDIKAYGKTSEDEDSEEGVWEATSNAITVQINGDYENFIKQKIDKILAEDNDSETGIVGLFKKDLNDFKIELKKYSLNRLISFHDAADAVRMMLDEQGVSNGETWGVVGEGKNLYDEIFVPYRDKVAALDAEIAIRDSELEIITGTRDEDGNIVTQGLQTYLESAIEFVQNELDFEKYIGEELWKEFCCFRREDKYSNKNFTSEGLNNAEIFEKTVEFLNVAENEIYKSSELSPSISSTLNNLLKLEEFKPLIEKFKVGNWLRVEIDDEIYRVRLIEYDIDYDDIESIDVEFSDTVKSRDSISDIQSILKQASSISTSYSYVKRQAKQGEESNEIIDKWADKGLDVTNTKIVSGSTGQTQTWDEYGMLFRKYDDINKRYEPEQLKIINSTIAITNDNWENTQTAIGSYYHIDPVSKEVIKSYGVNAETIVGRLLLGEQLRLANKSGTLVFDNDNGLSATSADKSKRVIINPDDYSILKVQKGNNGNYSNVLSFGDDGNLLITGNITATGLTLAQNVEIASNKVSGLSDVALTGNYDDLIDKPNLKAVATSGNYNDLTNKPSLSTVATSGSYNDLLDKPELSNVAISGNYSDLIGKPELSNVAISGSYNDLLGKPSLSAVATSGSYNDLLNKPTLSAIAESGNYNDLKATAEEAGNLMYIDSNGDVTSITIEQLKTLLGI